MKTTIDIPDLLYKRAKIRAVETGQSFKSILLASLEHELQKPIAMVEEKASYWTHRKLLPEY